MSPRTTPVRIDLKRDERLQIEWKDGVKSVYPIEMLRAMCPCAHCRQIRQESSGRKAPLLRVLPGNYAGPVHVVKAQRVGNYALRLEWSDEHASGIYSFAYLREISPQQ